MKLKRDRSEEQNIAQASPERGKLIDRAGAPWNKGLIEPACSGQKHTRKILENNR